MNELNIHDIKNLTLIEDYSFYIFLLLISLFLVIVIAGLIFLYKFLKKRKDTSKLLSIKILKELDFKDAKKSAYAISKHAKKLISNEREEKLYEELFDELSQYKYKKDVQSIKDETKQKFKLFMDVLDVK